MHRFRSVLLACLTSALIACSGGDAPRTAEFVPPVPTQQDFGNLRVRFNALPTLSLSKAMAQEYGVTREAGTALVVIALRQMEAGEEVVAEGEVTAIARDLSGKPQRLEFREVRTGEYIDYIATVKTSTHDTYRFDVTVRANGQAMSLQFSRNF